MQRNEWRCDCKIHWNCNATSIIIILTYKIQGNRNIFPIYVCVCACACTFSIIKKYKFLSHYVLLSSQLLSWQIIRDIKLARFMSFRARKILAENAQLWLYLKLDYFPTGETRDHTSSPLCSPLRHCVAFRKLQCQQEFTGTLARSTTVQQIPSREFYILLDTTIRFIIWMTRMSETNLHTSYMYIYRIGFARRIWLREIHIVALSRTDVIRRETTLPQLLHFITRGFIHYHVRGFTISLSVLPYR